MELIETARQEIPIRLANLTKELIHNKFSGTIIKNHLRSLKEITDYAAHETHFLPALENLKIRNLNLDFENLSEHKELLSWKNQSDLSVKASNNIIERVVSYKISLQNFLSMLNVSDISDDRSSNGNRFFNIKVRVVDVIVSLEKGRVKTRLDV